MASIAIARAILKKISTKYLKLKEKVMKVNNLLLIVLAFLLQKQNAIVRTLITKNMRRSTVI